MEKDRQLVIIKGTKEGFVFELDDEHLFADVYNELAEKLAVDHYPVEYGREASVIIKLGYRYVTEIQKEEIQRLIEKSNRFKVERFDSFIVTKDEARSWLEQSQIKMVNQIVRSGQVVDIKGDLLLLGDVNPGGLVSATGNIFVMGNLLGIAHAGKEGDNQAIIVASYMNPTQLRIGKFFSRSPDYESKGVYMECGYYDDEKNQIIIDRLQVLPYVRKELRNLERRILNG